MDSRYRHLGRAALQAGAVIRRCLLEFCGLLACFASTFYICSWEMPDAESGKISANTFWPLLKDPDTLLALQGQLRSLLFFSAFLRLRENRRCCLAPTYQHFLIVTQVLRFWLHMSHDAFCLEGPFAGIPSMCIDVCSLIAVCMLVFTRQEDGRPRLLPLLAVLVVCVYVSWENR